MSEFFVTRKKKKDQIMESLIEGSDNDSNMYLGGVQEDDDPKRMEFIEKYTKIAVCKNRRDGVYDFENLIICEPRNFKERVKAYLTNGFESILVCGLLIAGIGQPSLNSALYIILTQNMFITSTMAPKIRLSLGRIFMWLNFLVLCIGVYMKWMFIKNFNNNSIEDTIGLLGKKKIDQCAQISIYGIKATPATYAEAFGCVFTIPCGNADNKQPMIDNKNSFVFEGLLGILYIATISFIQDQLNLRAQLKKKQLNLLFDKVVKDKKDFFSDTEEEESVAIDVFAARSEQSLLKKEKNKKKIFDALVKSNLASFSPCFFDCQQFTKQNKRYFIMIVIFQLGQTMGFNGLFDIPSLLILLVSVSLYAYRKSFPVFFGSLQIVFAYFVKFSILIKIIMSILIRTPAVNNVIKRAQPLSSKVIMMVFGDQNDESKHNRLVLSYLLMILTLSYAQIWIQLKWIDIRRTLKMEKGINMCNYFSKYILLKEEERARKPMMKQLVKNIKDELSNKKMTDKKKRFAGQDKDRDYLSDIKNDYNQYMPVITLVVVQFLLTFQAYMYHTNISLFQLMWVISSFIFPLDVSLYTGFALLLPTYSLQFTIIYGLQIPIVKDLELFKRAEEFFPQSEYMKFPIAEKILYFVILANLFLFLSCMKLVQDHKQETLLKNFMYKKIKEGTNSIGWNFLYFFFKYIQCIVLVILFINGAGQLNNLRNLGFMIFFIVYSASEEAYRKTGNLLIIFLAYFIVGQYAFSLIYLEFEGDPNYEQFKWFGLYEEEGPNWRLGDEIYFRHTPWTFYWVVLVLMAVLKAINQIFVDSNEGIKAKALEQLSQNGIQMRFKDQFMLFTRMKNGFSTIMILFVLGLSFWLIGKLQTTLISWVFFSLNIILFAFISRQDNKKATHEWSLKFAKVLNFFSAFILIVDILFLVFAGEDLEQLSKTSWAYYFIQAIGKEDLDVVGLAARKQNLMGGKSTQTEAEYQNQVLQYKFYTYILFQLSSIYVQDYFTNQMNQFQYEQLLDEDFYTRLFNYVTDVRELNKEQDQSEEAQSFANKKQFSYLDVQQFYENIRFTQPFQVYQMINWWPTFDILATYGHIVNNLVIIYIAIYCNISLFMCINIFLVCLNYARQTVNLNVIANNFFVQFGVLNQVDLKMANMVTKKYKSAASFEYLRIRQNTWRLQLQILVIVCILGFPTTLIQVERAKIMQEETPNVDKIKSMDKIVFICYIIGLYKDPEGKESSNDYFYFSLAVLFFGLVVEKLAINWLTDRHGCDYFRLQKFIELEQRYNSIVNKNWQAPHVPKYDVNSYKKYYYHENFDYLKERFIKSHKQQEEDRKKAKTKSKDKEIEGFNSNINFVPHPEAVRIKECITFCLQLKGQDIELNLSDEEQVQLSQIEMQYDDDFDGEEIDEESVPVLKNYKLKQLENILVQNVNRKYKISFFKGSMFAIEGFILLLLMISVVLKANVFSIIYMFFIVKYLLGRAKAELLVRLNLMISVTFAVQYLIYLLNLTSYSNPQPFPPQMRFFPQVGKSVDDKMSYFPYSENETFNFGFPVFFQASVFQDMKVSYMLGIGIEIDQLQNLVIDYIIMYMVTMFIMIYRNPILFKGVEKVFWQFPSMTDEQEKWARLDEKVSSQVKWILKPLEWDANRYQGLLDDLKYDKKLPEFNDPKIDKDQIKYKKIAKFQYDFAREYDDHSQDLNERLIQYVDIKYDTIWSDEFLKEKKREFKNLSLYFRLVKQGSILVYLTFHIITIMIVLLMATMRQSLFSIGYVVIIVYNVKQGSKVLIQRDQSKHKERNNLVMDLQEKKDILEAEQNRPQPNSKLLKELKDEIESLQIKLNILENDQDVDWSNEEEKEWQMKTIVEKYLLLWAIFDFVLQIIAQLPIVPQHKEIEVWGFRKIWTLNDQQQINSYSDISYYKYVELLKSGDNTSFTGFHFDKLNFLMQCMNCFMISFLSMQAEIFKSPGYKKFITQKGGSMDLLMEIAPLKAKSIAYCFNNEKIRRIINIQRRKETINKTVEELAKRLIYWRKKTNHKLGVYPESVLFPKIIEEYDEDYKSDDESKAPNAPQQERADSPNKKVAFEDQTLDQQLIQQFEKEEQKRRREKAKLMTPEESEQLQKQLCMEFIKAKKEKMNIFCQLYFSIQDTFVNKILFKNTRELLEPILKTHAEGQYFIPTELEAIMISETSEMMRKYYGHREGSKELKKILQDSKRTKTSLLENDQFFKTVKLKDMKRTWEFTRPFSMMFKLIEVLYYAIISNTQTLIYVTMIMSIYQNAGILSVIYPILIFGYALLEETRPRVWFWEFIRNYNQVVILIKFILNLSVFEKIMENQSVLTLAAYIKPGVYNYTNILDLLPYMLPEILIMALIMLNEINLKLCGLYTKIEADIETITEGIDRNIEKGDQEAVHRKKVASRNMMMNKYFYSMEEQLKNIEQYEKEMQDEQKVPQYFGLNRFKQSQISIIQATSKGIWKSSKEFDIDVSANNTSSDFDQMIKDNILKKSLENDNLIIFEGQGQNNSDSMFISQDQLREEIDDENELDNLSAGDFDDDFEEKNYVIEGKDIPKKGFFENNPYFNTLFPSLKIQKPGEDYYGQTTFILIFMLIYIIMYWSYITVDPGIMLKSVKDSSKIFNGFMSIMAITTIFVIVLERYVNRCDTKAVKQGSIDEVMNTGGASFFNKQEMGFQQQSTQRSMTLKLQTMKTSDIDVQGGGAQDFLKAMYGGEEGVNNFDDSRTQITFAQRTKYVMHQIITYVIHVLVFWYVPIQGNEILFGSPQCDVKQEEQCRDFEKNGYLRFYYLIVCLYLYLSACQIRAGFPILKKPSSVLDKNDSIVGMLKAQIFAPIPFITELRCLFDFAFSKTSLDIFQFFQLFQYHIEMFINKAGNWSYTYKILGSKVELLDKIIFGWLIGGVVLFFLITPLYFFSDAGTFIEPNTVNGGQLAIQFLIEKNITICEMLESQLKKQKNLQSGNAQLDFDLEGLDEETQMFLQGMNNNGTQLFDSAIPEYCKLPEDQIDEKYRALHQKQPYEIYRSKNPGVRTFDDILFQNSKLSTLTETRFFKPKQIQEAYFQETSDVNWLLSRESIKQLTKDLGDALEKNPVNHDMKLRISYTFDRIGPPDAVEASNQKEVSFNSSRLSGCQTRNQLLDVANLDCKANPQAKQDIIFFNAYNPNLVLGSDKNIGIMLFDAPKKETQIMQNHDLKLTFICPDQWYVQYNTLETKLFTDPDVEFSEGGCKIKDSETYGTDPDLKKLNNNYGDGLKYTQNWSRIRFILLSMMISSGIFAGYNVITFYTLVVLVLGAKIRPIFLFNFWRGASYETQDPDAFIKLVEACYMRRHEEDLIGEEECYRMMQEFVRCPELFKAICGSSMKGTIDPKLDKLTDEQRQKLTHLDMLEKKGFEVQKLRDDIMKQSGQKDDLDELIGQGQQENLEDQM